MTKIFNFDKHLFLNGIEMLRIFSLHSRWKLRRMLSFVLRVGPGPIRIIPITQRVDLRAIKDVGPYIARCSGEFCPRSPSAPGVGTDEGTQGAKAAGRGAGLFWRLDRFLVRFLLYGQYYLSIVSLELALTVLKSKRLELEKEIPIFIAQPNKIYI